MINNKQIKCARSLLGIGQIELAKQSGVSLTVIRRLEIFNEEYNPTVNTIKKIQTAFESQGVKFINKDGEFGATIIEQK